MNRDELTNALSNAQSIQISVSDYIWFQELKEKELSKGINLSDEPLELDPFAITTADTILKYREIINNLIEVSLDYNSLKSMSDSEFFNAITK